MKKEDKENLIKDNFYFTEGDRFLDAAGFNRDWPLNRAIFHNNDKTILVWVNQEDHLKVSSI